MIIVHKHICNICVCIHICNFLQAILWMHASSYKCLTFRYFDVKGPWCHLPCWCLGYPTEKWRMRPHSIFNWGKRVKGRGFLRRPGQIRRERYPGITHQPIHLLQSFPFSYHIWPGPRGHSVWQCHLQSSPPGKMAVCILGAWGKSLQDTTPTCQASMM